MKIIYCIILCCSCLVSCNSQAKNKEMKSDLNLSLFFYPSMSVGRVIYSIDIINDSLIIKKNNSIDNKEYRGKLTDNQCAEILKMISLLTQKQDRSNNFALDVWGCTLKINDKVYYEDNFFSFLPQSKIMGWQSPPEEIKLLIDYIVSLSPIEIELYSFS